MSAIAIDRMTVRYRLPRAAWREQTRLRRIMADALDRVLEQALERSGVGRGDYVCIRAMQASFTLGLHEPDSTLAGRLGDAIALAIHGAAGERSSSVVRYGSRVQALIDLAVHALGGDFTRSWAWTQVGIWHADVPRGTGAAADLIVRTLAAEARYAPAVVTYLARARPEAFATMISLATPHAWNALAVSALAVAGGGNAGRRTDRAVNGPATDAIARRIVAESAIAWVVIGRLPQLHEDTRRALAAFALLEIEPAAIWDVRDPRDLNAIEHAMTRVTTATRIERAAHEPAEHADRAQTDPQPRRVDADPARAPRSGLDPSETAASRHPSSSTHALHAMATDRLEGRHDVDESSDDPADDPSAGVPDVRRFADTGRGGVLYLVNLIEQIGLVEVIRRDDRWPARGIRWVLHRLAMLLGRTGPSDPAVLAFAGLPPGSPPPSSQQAPPDEAEAAALETLRATIAGSLRDALARPDAGESASMDEVCARRAQVVVDPGWIEVRFRLEDVSVDVRRAGLDLDPDWVPWLGVVMRFVYA